MYPNLRAEMARESITSRDIEKKLGKSNYWLSNRLQGKCRFSIPEGQEIISKFFPDCTMDYLFKSK